MRALLAIATVSQFVASSPVVACGADTDCHIGDRHYRVRMPVDHAVDERIGAIVFAHGFGGSASGILRNRRMIELADELGVAIIATKSAAKDWSIPGAPSAVTQEGVDELAYFDTVIRDATEKFLIDENRLMMSGFSAGAMMVWNLACYRSDMFAAFAPIAGTFWRPEPLACDTPPASIVHIHGESDKTVPLEGRPVLDTHQGNVATVIDWYSDYGSYAPTAPFEVADLRCKNSRNAAGRILGFCLFSGGHSFNPDHVGEAWKMFEISGQL